MKELSIEQKAQRYDEVLKVLHKYDGANIMFSQSLKEEMFPELAESEDERIRKEILLFLREGKPYHCPNSAKRQEWAAWLEKQRAVDVLDEEEREFADNVDSYRKEIDAAYQKGYNEGVKAIFEKQSEQNPAWTEKDEHWRQKAIDFMKHPDLIKATPTLAKDTIDWLKSLRDKVQPKQEWSEEDIEMLNSAISFVEHSAFTTIGKGKNNVISWLKSLKERIGE